MQVSHKLLPRPETFEPREVFLRIDTQEQADAISAVFNYTPICSAISGSGVDSQKVRESTGGDLSSRNQYFLKLLERRV